MTMPTRRTLRLAVEVVVDEYDAAYDSGDLADDVRGRFYSAIVAGVPRDVVMMTVTAADEPPAPEVPAPAHEFTGTVKRADGVIVTATLAVPETHPMAKPGPHRPWHGTAPSNQNFIELGELAMMIAQQGYATIERNERGRVNWGKQDYWADLLNIEVPTPALEAGK